MENLFPISSYDHAGGYPAYWQWVLGTTVFHTEISANQFPRTMALSLVKCGFMSREYSHEDLPALSRIGAGAIHSSQKWNLHRTECTHGTGSEDHFC